MVRRYHQLNGHELTAEDEMVSITNLMDMNLNKLWVIFEGQGSLGWQRVQHDLATGQQQGQYKSSSVSPFHPSPAKSFASFFLILPEYLPPTLSSRHWFPF